ncbi:hypothetical protein LPJ66_008165 [Kickxella alabastrina]|uniref:Uncharacterized protein n=1 Tax=Kickxella alabastrina TaxID=61397 RepID=A0ACC1I963_9FUNG|nr:hypothetical protein LPJ66_008165 [Kickxella alabastrina]
MYSAVAPTVESTSSTCTTTTITPSNSYAVPTTVPTPTILPTTEVIPTSDFGPTSDFNPTIISSKISASSGSVTSGSSDARSEVYASSTKTAYGTSSFSAAVNNRELIIESTGDDIAASTGESALSTSTGNTSTNSTVGPATVIVTSDSVFMSASVADVIVAKELAFALADVATVTVISNSTTAALTDIATVTVTASTSMLVEIATPVTTATAISTSTNDFASATSVLVVESIIVPPVAFEPSSVDSLDIELKMNQGCALINHGAMTCPSGQVNVHKNFLECVWGKVVTMACPEGTVCVKASPANANVICDRPKH